MLPRVHLIRHGETEWSLLGRHTGRTDILLTSQGAAQARRLGERLHGIEFSWVLTSPRLRARQTCELAGLGASAAIEEQLAEWDYGQFEGLTTAEIRRQRPNWELFTDGAPGGESPADIYARACGVVQRLIQMEGNVAVFSHGHFLRVLAAAWIKLPVAEGKRFGLNTASLSILGFEHARAEEPIISLWNETSVPRPE